jgi:hypothetical protein
MMKSALRKAKREEWVDRKEFFLRIDIRQSPTFYKEKKYDYLESLTRTDITRTDTKEKTKKYNKKQQQEM